MEWQVATIADVQGPTYKIPNRWLRLYYYEALNILFRVENALRVLVYVALKNEYKAKWLDSAIMSDEGEGTISSIANRRRKQAATFGYLGYPVTCPLMYLTTGELIRVITSDAYRKLFGSHFLGAKPVVTTKLEEIASVRNALAHFRPIAQDDVDSIKQGSKHVLTIVEKVLADMIRCPTTVPTNTSDKWYTELRVLGTKHCKLRFMQNTNEEWVRVDLSYQPPTAKRYDLGSGHSLYSTLKLSAPAIILLHPQLAAVITYVTESMTHEFVEVGKVPEFSKTISFGFRRQTVQGNQEIVKEGIEGVLKLIEEETELVEQDNLARGKLVSSTSVSIQIPEGRHASLVQVKELDSGFKDNDPPEWWGQMSLYVPDFVSATHIFPWMPTAIAQPQF